MKRGALLLVAGGAAVILFAQPNKKKKKKRSAASNGKPQNGAAQDMDVEDSDESEAKSEPKAQPEPAPAGFSKYVDPAGRARLGMMYLIKPGDTPLEVAREALFGTRAPTADPVKRRQAMELLVRMDCSPYNQAIYGRPLSELKQGHANIDSYWTQKGVSFDPIYTDNYEMIMNGNAPSAAPGNSYAFIWIPMIDVDRFDTEGIVTTEGMYHPDTAQDMGGSMIDPPVEIISLGLNDAQTGVVGCNLPEGDFRKTIVAS